MNADHIVEVYSAGNIVEAESLVEVLEEAGVAARVVGDELGNAAGWIPQAELAPRVWVRQADEARAREIIAAWLRDPRAIVAEGAPVGDEEGLAEPPDAASLAAAGDEDREAAEADDEDVETDDADEPASRARRVFRLLNGVIAVAGVGSILAGGYFAAETWLTLRQFPETTEGRFIGDEFVGVDYQPPPAAARDLPVRMRGDARVTYRDYYAYRVDGRVYYAELEAGRESPETVTIHYDPNRPSSHVVGPLLPPWASLSLGTLVGGLLLLVAWRFR